MSGIRVPFVVLGMASALVGASCSAVVATPTPTPTCAGSICGLLISPNTSSPVALRNLVLCRVDPNTPTPTTAAANQSPDASVWPCALLRESVKISGSNGTFDFGVVSPGTYLLLYNSDLTSFGDGLDRWAPLPPQAPATPQPAKTIRLGDVQWLHDNYFDLDSKGNVEVFHPKETEPAPAAQDDWLLLYRLFGQGPFFWAHDCASGICTTWRDVLPVKFEVTDGSHSYSTFPVFRCQKDSTC